MSYRPENPYKPQPNNLSMTLLDRLFLAGKEEAYEAGADAYEAALKERGKKVIVTDTVRDNLYGEDRLVSEKVQTGWQVFIPEEEP